MRSLCCAALNQFSRLHKVKQAIRNETDDTEAPSLSAGEYNGDAPSASQQTFSQFVRHANEAAAAVEGEDAAASQPGNEASSAAARPLRRYQR